MAKNQPIQRNTDARMSLFGRLAVESGLVSYDDIVAAIEEQDRLRSEGIDPPKLGELLVQNHTIAPSDVDVILRMQANPNGLIGRMLVDNRLVTKEQLREALDVQYDYQQRGLTPPRLGDVVVQKGFAKAKDIQLLMKRQETPGNLFGEFLVANKVVKQEDIDRSLLAQKDAADKGEKPMKLGEVLVKQGVLTPEQLEMLARRHLQSRRRFAVATPATPAEKKKRADARVVRGDYLVRRSLGHHVDGVTYEAVHSPSDAVVALHLFKEGIGGDEAFAARCEKALKLQHSAIQRLLSHETVGTSKAVVAEFVEGETLDSIIGGGGPIEWVWAAEIAYEFADALRMAEAIGLSHDDIRPSSILVDSAGKAKLGLWEYSRDPIENREWLAKRSRAIPFYFAPERLSSGPSVRSDIFSLGLTLVHALTGKAPLHGNTAAEAVESYSAAEIMQELALDLSLPLEFVGIIARMIDANPDNRYRSFGEMFAEIDGLREEQGLDFSIGSGPLLIDSAMDSVQASGIIQNFLQTDMGVRREAQLSMWKMAGHFAFPAILMIVLMLATTAVYRYTQSATGLMVRANWRDHQGDRQGALSLFRLISSIYPDDPKVQQRYYDLSLELKDYGEAEEALERLMAIYPEKRVEYLEMQGDLQVWQKRFTSGVELYRQVAAYRQNDLKLKLKIANGLLWAKEYQEAQTAFADLAFLNPNDDAILLGMARSAAGSGNYAAAAESYARLANLTPLAENVLMEYAWALAELKREDELKRLAQSALSRPDTSKFTRRDLTFLNFWAGNFPETARLLATLSDISSNDRDNLTFRIAINSQLENLDALAADYARLAEIDNDWKPLFTLASIYQGKNDFDKADVYFRQALARSPDNPEIMRAIAQNLSYDEKRRGEAQQWYRDALAKNPDDMLAVKGLGRTLVWERKYRDALPYVERAYRAEPDDPENRLDLAIVYTQIGRGAEALPWLTEMLEKGDLSIKDREQLAVNAMVAQDNDLLLRLAGSWGDELGEKSETLAEMRLILARRLRAKQSFAMALPVYAAVLSAQEQPDTALLVEMAETAGWAGQHDLATKWLEMAREIVEARESGGIAAGQQIHGDGFSLPPETWDSLLAPLRENPDIYRSLSGFKAKYGKNPIISERN